MAPRLGIIAGAGALPRLLVQACRDTGRPVFVVAVNGETDPETPDGVDHIWIDRVAVGAMLDALKAAGVAEVVMIGPMRRPDFRSLRPVDRHGVALLARLVVAATRGDDVILQTMIEFFEKHGFRVVGAETVLPAALAPMGQLGRLAPSEAAQADIDKGVAVVRALGQLDVGQACVVRDGHVLAVEAAEGTDAMLARVAGLGAARTGGVLVKLPKPGQQRLADLPTIGVRTVEGAAAAGLSGIAYEGGAALLAERDAIVAAADAAGLFLVGLKP